MTRPQQLTAALAAFFAVAGVYLFVAPLPRGVVYGVGVVTGVLLLEMWARVWE